MVIFHSKLLVYQRVDIPSHQGINILNLSPMSHLARNQKGPISSKSPSFTAPMKCSHHKIDRYRYTHIRSYNIILTSSTIIYPSYTHYTRIISASSVISYITSCHSEFIVFEHPSTAIDSFTPNAWLKLGTSMAGKAPDTGGSRWISHYFFGAKCGGCSSQNHTKPLGQDVESPRSEDFSPFPSFRSCPNIYPYDPNLWSNALSHPQISRSHNPRPRSISATSCLSDIFKDLPPPVPSGESWHR